MKSNSRACALFLALMGLVWVGCESKSTPLGAYAAPSSVPNYALVCNFDNTLPGDTTAMTNANLFEIGAAGNTIASPGSWSIINNFPANESAVLTMAVPGANGTPLAAHVTGTIADPGTGVYPSISMDGFLDAASTNPNKAYNASFFTGVKFFINITSGDTATDRHFYMPVAQEDPPPVGTCNAGSTCYNYFGYTFTTGTNGWKQFSFAFKDLADSYGFKPTPATFTGVNLAQVLRIRFMEGRANTAGTSNVDFWVDEVYFY